MNAVKEEETLFNCDKQEALTWFKRLKTENYQVKQAMLQLQQITKTNFPPLRTSGNSKDKRELCSMERQSGDWDIILNIDLKN